MKEVAESVANELIVRPHAHEVVLKLRWGADPVHGWNVQNIFHMNYAFYKRMSTLMDFDHALQNMLQTEDTKGLAERLQKDPDFYLEDYQGQHAVQTYFPSGKVTDPQFDWSAYKEYKRHLSYSAGYKKGKKDGAAYTWSLDATDATHTPYLAEKIEYKNDMKNGLWLKYHKPCYARFAKGKDNKDHWDSLGIEREKLYAFFNRPMGNWVYDDNINKHFCTDGLVNAYGQSISFYSSDEHWFESNQNPYSQRKDPYHVDTSLAFCATMKDDDFDGIVCKWHANQQLAEYDEYQGDYLVNEKYKYHDNGQLKSFTIYPSTPALREITKEGKIIGRVPIMLYQAQFDENGEILFAADYDEQGKATVHSERVYSFGD